MSFDNLMRVTMKAVSCSLADITASTLKMEAARNSEKSVNIY
jgi:hypothetical protein